MGLKDTAFDLTAERAKRYIVTDEKLEKYVNDTIDGTYKPQWISEKLNIPSTDAKEEKKEEKERELLYARL